MSALQSTVGSSLRSGQRGVVLFVALIVLVVMTLSGIALLRQLGVGTSIAGNMAFKESATSIADRGVEQARDWLTTNSTLVNSDSAADGYYSSWGASVDPNTFNWSTAASGHITAEEAETGNKIRFVIHRLCATPNLSPADPAQVCSDALEASAGGSKGGTSYGTLNPAGQARPFYRVTTRVEGPRGTVSYTQVLMN